MQGGAGDGEDRACDAAVVARVFSESTAVAIVAQVKEWLEDGAPDFVPAEVRPALLAGKLPDADRLHYTLAEREYEDAVNETLFCMLRRGQVEGAARFAVAVAQPWKAAIITGGQYHDGRSGNQRRAVWRDACAALAANDTISVRERAIYASLVGRLDVLQRVSQSWEDVLWSHTVALIDGAIEDALVPGSRLPSVVSLRGAFESIEGDPSLHRTITQCDSVGGVGLT